MLEATAFFRPHRGTDMRKLAIFAAALIGVGIFAGGSALANSPKAALTLSPTFVSAPGDGPGGCPAVGGLWVCHVTLTNPSSSNVKVTWESIGTNDFTGSGASATVSPASGVLSPGKSVRVTITTNACGGYFDLNMFLGGPVGSPVADYPLGDAVMYTCG
jgi:hypothetical protein